MDAMGVGEAVVEMLRERRPAGAAGVRVAAGGVDRRAGGSGGPSAAAGTDEPGWP